MFRFYFAFQMGSLTLPKLASDWEPPNDTSFLCCSSDRYILPCPAYWLRWGLSNYCLGWPWTSNPHDFCLPRSWDYKRELPVPILYKLRGQRYFVIETGKRAETDRPAPDLSTQVGGPMDARTCGYGGTSFTKKNPFLLLLSFSLPFAFF
jgi:hypothetical protein